MPSPDDIPDDLLPVFTKAQARRFHDVLQTVLTEYGTSHHWDGDDYYTVDGIGFGLFNLAAAVAPLSETEWADAIDNHVKIFIRTRENDLPAVTAGMVYPRIRRARDGEAGAHTRRLTDATEVVLAVDYPDVVEEVDSTDRLSHLGTPADLWDTAMANLRTLPEPTLEVIEPDDDTTSSRIYAFQFDDYFGPSRLLLGNEFCGRYFPLTPSGLFVLIPYRHAMLVAEVTDRVLTQCGELAAIASSLYEASPGPTSPSVYHLTAGGEITEAAYVNSDDAIHVRLNPTLERLLTMTPEDGRDQAP